jgi:adenosylcobinamide-phosphate synthase
MAAMALLLGVRLRKPGVYVLNPAGRAPLPCDLQRAAVWGSRLVLLLAVCAGAVICIPVLAAQSSFVAKEYMSWRSISR